MSEKEKPLHRKSEKIFKDGKTKFVITETFTDKEDLCETLANIIASDIKEKAEKDSNKD